MSMSMYHVRGRGHIRLCCSCKMGGVWSSVDWSLSRWVFSALVDACIVEFCRRRENLI